MISKKNLPKAHGAPLGKENVFSTTKHSDNACARQVL